jgi:hypothetical protein
MAERQPMAYKLTNYERETILLFNEAEDKADVTTYNAALIRKLGRLAEERPREIKLVGVNDDGGCRYEIPKGWIKVNATMNLTDEEKQRRSDAGKRAHAKNLT